MSRNLLPSLGILALLCIWTPSLNAQTYRHTWTTSLDFQGGTQINVNAQEVVDQLQLSLTPLETPYLCIANTASNTVARVESETGQVLSVTTMPVSDSNPSHTAVDLDFNCWVSVHHPQGRVYQIDARHGFITETSAYVGQNACGVAVDAAGHIWASSFEDDGLGFGWKRFNYETLEELASFHSDLASYGIAINSLGKMFSTTGESGEELQRFEEKTGALEQVWDLAPALSGGADSIAVDLEGDLWGSVRLSPTVIWVDGDYQCPGNAQRCALTEGNGLHRIIDVSDVLLSAGSGAGTRSGRGIAVDDNGFVWALFNDRTDGNDNQSYLVKIDRATGDPLFAAPTGLNSAGVTPDADGFVWVVNQDGGGGNLIEHDCPNEGGNEGTGTVTKLRSSDGSVVATYPTCGDGPRAHSDMAGYALRSVTLRAGTWRAVHDSGLEDFAWDRIDWNSQEPNDTTFRVRARVANTQEALAQAGFVALNNGASLPQGRYAEVEVFLSTRSEFLGPALESLTLSGPCVPEDEVCDGLDNDCDGVVDNDNPDGGGDCFTGLDGVCAMGETSCNRGRFACNPVLEPAEEVCDGQDNDCDGETDENLLNICGTCGPVPEEICNGIDDDCDGETDENVLNACGECGPVPEETCNGLDDDCDGETDEGAQTLCGNGSRCMEGSCAEPCEEGECRRGFLCVDNFCMPDPCSEVTCEEGETCNNGACEDACSGTTCEPGFVCNEGQCVEDLCFNVECASGQACDQGNCVFEACVDTPCAEDQQCGPNGCEPLGTCGETVCGSGELCIDGTCVAEDATDPKKPSGGSDDDGCGCSTPSSPRPIPWWPLVVLGAALTLRSTRRKRTNQSKP